MILIALTRDIVVSRFSALTKHSFLITIGVLIFRGKVALINFNMVS